MISTSVSNKSTYTVKSLGNHHHCTNFDHSDLTWSLWSTVGSWTQASSLVTIYLGLEKFEVAVECKHNKSIPCLKVEGLTAIVQPLQANSEFFKNQQRLHSVQHTEESLPGAKVHYNDLKSSERFDWSQWSQWGEKLLNHHVEQTGDHGGVLSGDMSCSNFPFVQHPEQIGSTAMVQYHLTWQIV